MTAVRTAKPGPTAAARAVITASSAPLADPGVLENGYNIQGADFLHLYADLGAATSATVTPWYWNLITEKWHEDAANQKVFTATQRRHKIDTHGEERVFLVLDAIGGAGTVTIWAGYSYGDADVR